MIALLTSVHAEGELLTARAERSRVIPLGSKSIIEGRIANQDIILCIGGMGKVNTAHAATLLLTRYAPEALIIFGIGGAYPSSRAAVGSVALAKEEIAGDEGVLIAEGFKDTEYIGIPLLKTATSVMYNTYPAPDSLLNRARRALAAQAGGEDPFIGSFVTLSTCTGTSVRARELEKRYHGLCENMEGAAAAHIAELHGVPWLEVRGISNLVEDRDLNKWNIPKAAEAAQNAVIRILEGWQ